MTYLGGVYVTPNSASLLSCGKTHRITESRFQRKLPITVVMPQFEIRCSILHGRARELCYIFAIIGSGPGEESQMASLFFTCPTTHQHVPTGIETDVQSLQATWKATLKVKCPHCGGVHEVSVRETYINGALDDATDRLRSI